MKRLILLLIMILSNAMAAPKVVVTIKPIHSLVCAIMKGIGTPVLLMNNVDSPHLHILRPNEMAELHNADLVIWVGENYETEMRNAILSLDTKKTILTLMDIDGLNRLQNRVGKLWGGEADLHEHKAGDEHAFEWDGHIWLAPNNARAILFSVTKILSYMDPLNANFYEENCRKALTRLDNLAQELLKDTRDVKGKMYLLYHDSTQYFDHYFGTQAVGAIVPEPGRSPSAYHVDNLIIALKTTQIMCIFMEPQFDLKIVKMLSYESNVPYAQLDYLGVNLQPGEDAYYEMMRRFTNAVIEGVKGKGAKTTAKDAKDAKDCRVRL